MERVEKTIDVRAPLHAVYDQWTQFEDFPRFMPGVKAVRQIDDTHVHWNAEVWGKDEEWDAEITEQEPDKRISWKSISGKGNAGTVRCSARSADSRSSSRRGVGQPVRGAARCGTASRNSNRLLPRAQHHPFDTGTLPHRD